MPETRGEGRSPILLELLGSLSLQAHDGTEPRSSALQPKRLALLSYLAIARPRGLHQRDKLVALLWPDLDQERARAALSQSLYVLRGALGADAFRTRGNEEVGLKPGVLAIDVVEFEAALERNDGAAALQLYRGDLLDGFHVSGAPEFERWLDEERARLRLAAQQAAWTLSDQADTCGDHAATARWARRAFSFTPHDEAALRRLMGALEAAHDIAGALRAYDEYAAWLRNEYDADPSSSTRTVAQFLRKRSQEPAVTAAIAVDDAVAVPASTPASDPVSHPTSRSRVALFAALALVAFIGLGTLAVLRTRHDRPVAHRVAVLPFVVRGDSQLAYLADGMVDLLSAKLDGAGPIRTVDPHALLHYVSADEDRLNDPEAARAVAERFRAGLFVIGSIVEVGGKLQGTATLYDSNGRQQVSATATATSERELLNMVDDLARGLLASQLREPDSRLARAAVTTTSSFLALKAYLQGEALFRDSRYEEAFDAYTRATTIDSTFSLAWYRLAVTADWVDAQQTIVSSLSKALRYGDRLDGRERDLVEALMLYWRATPQEAENAYARILRTYPDDIDAWYHYAEVLFHWGPVLGRSAVLARPAFEHVLQLQPTNTSALAHLARIAGIEHEPLRADSFAKRLLAVDPDAKRTPELKLLRASLMKDTADLRTLIGQLDSLSDHAVWVAAWRVAAYAADPVGALAIMRHNVAESSPPATRENAYLSIAHFEAARGRFAAAADELDKAGELFAPNVLETYAFLQSLPFAPDNPAGLMLLLERLRLKRGSLDADTVYRVARVRLAEGLVAARLGMLDSAKHQLAALDPAKSRNPHFVELHNMLLGAIAYRESSPSAKRNALDRFTDWQPRIGAGVLRDPAYTYAGLHFLRAELLYQLGRYEQALNWFNGLSDDFGFDVVFLAPATLRSAEIYERTGQRDLALKNYARFIELWRDADPELQPVVDAARAKVQRLRRDTR